jgi:hypothetical protein
MNIATSIEQYDIANVFFCEPTKNNIIENGMFIRIIYASDITLNGIYIWFSLHDVICEKYYNKCKYCFSLYTYSKLVNALKEMEENILNKYKSMCNNKKTPLCKIYEHIQKGNIKLFQDVETNQEEYLFVLKISGVWETADYYGLTYKFNIVSPAVLMQPDEPIRGKIGQYIV